MSYLIDPEARTATLVDLDAESAEEFLDALRRAIGAPQINCLPVAGSRLAVWGDAMGML